MSKAEYTSILNQKLIQIARSLEEGSMQERSGLLDPLEQLEQILRDAQDMQVFFAYGNVCESLHLVGTERLLLAVLWYQKRQRESGIAYERMRMYFDNYGGMADGFVLAPCFRIEQGSVYLSPVTYAYLEGDLPKLFAGMELILPHPEKCYNREQLLAIGNEIWTKKKLMEEHPLALVLTGEEGSGRHFAARQLAAEWDRALLEITNTQLLSGERELNELLLCAEFYQAVVCIDIDKKVPEQLLKRLSEYLPFVFLIKDTETSVYQDIGYVQEVQQLQTPDVALKLEIAADLLLHQDMPVALPKGVTLEMLAAKQLPIGVFIRYILNIRTELALGTFELEKNVFLPGSARLNLMPANRTMEELKLPPQQSDELEKICQIIASRKQMMEQWGFGKKYSYGNGISVLFYGAPGTGKTMAAQVMANRLGMPLFRVDLAQLISKYIGETQKNIGHIFDEAQKSGCILLFDEADALFARRSDVSDAQDRYSNAETAYLLQRIEQYDGVSILATNLLQNFDEAFRRRITYMLHFSMPDESLREELWENILPKTAPVEEIDYLALAQAFVMSGAEIKNAAFHAAGCAKAEDKPIGMKHMLDGIRNEFCKMGKSFNEGQKELANQYLR